MSFALEEYCEDAFVDYLTREVTEDTMNFYPGWSAEDIKYPCGIIHAGVSRNVGDAPFNGAREIDVQIAVQTEAVASATQSARARNRTARDAVLTALAQTALHEDLNAMNPKGVVFSRAMIGDTTRSTDSDPRVWVSEINVETIAAPEVVK